MFKELSNLASMMKQAQNLSGQMHQVQAALRERRVEGSAGGGLVRAEANGLGEILRIRLDPMLTDKGDREMIEDLTPAAVNDALEKAKQVNAQVMQDMFRDAQIPGMDEALSRLSGEDPQQ